MGQEAETNVKLEAGTLKEITEDFEQTRFRHGRGWLKSKNSGPNFMGRTVPKLLDLSKQGKTDLWELSIVGVCHKTPLLLPELRVPPYNISWLSSFTFLAVHLPINVFKSM